MTYVYDNPRNRRVELRLSPAQWYVLHDLAGKVSPYGERKTNAHTYGVLSRLKLIEVRPHPRLDWQPTKAGLDLLAELRATIDRAAAELIKAQARRHLTQAQLDQSRRDYIRMIAG